MIHSNELKTYGVLKSVHAKPITAQAVWEGKVLLDGEVYPVEAVSPAAWKQMFDTAFSLAVLIVLAIPVFAVLAIAIKLDTPGPVFFRQKRVGQNGRLFSCYKFRTMTHEPERTFAQAQQNDPRVTRVGKFLRKTNLDELPQFINVLRGEMSVVGPRPHVPELDKLFHAYVPGYFQRTAVKPGVTGLAQVSGCRGETRSVREMTHRVRFDIFYVRNINLLLDLEIIFLTVYQAVRGDKRAY